MIIDKGKALESGLINSMFDIDMEKWKSKKPFGISGCFRLKNEGEFMIPAVLSQLHWLDEAVLIVQKSDDDTEEKAQWLASRSSRIRFVRYPFDVAPPLTQEHIDTPANSVLSFVHLSNWALSQCRYSWISKVEGDVITLPTFRKIRDMVLRNRDADMYLGWVVLNVAGENQDRISLTSPRNAGWDEAVFNNHPRYHFVKHGKWETIHVNPELDHVRCMGWAGLHMKRCKARYWNGFDGETWGAFKRKQVAVALADYNKINPYPALDDPLGIEEFYKVKLPSTVLLPVAALVKGK